MKPTDHIIRDRWIDLNSIEDKFKKKFRTFNNIIEKIVEKVKIDVNLWKTYQVDKNTLKNMKHFVEKKVIN